MIECTDSTLSRFRFNSVLFELMYVMMRSWLPGPGWGGVENIGQLFTDQITFHINNAISYATAMSHVMRHLSYIFFL
jgi:hypothetical protein